jgi:nitrogen regulatory protein PII
MKLFIYVLHKTELLDRLLKELHKAGIKGATILNSTGMGRKLFSSDDQPFIGSLRALFMDSRVDSNMIFIVLPDEQVDTVYKVLDEVVGDLKLPSSGIAFTVPIDQIKGYKG